MKYLVFLSIITLAIACRKDNVEPYSGDNGIAFYLDEYEVDSLTYSFAFSLTQLPKDTVFLKMRIMGPAAKNDRTVKVHAVAGSTAREGKDYILPEFTVPAGAITIDYPVVLLNSPEMTSQSFRLVLEMQPNKDFVQGATGLEVGSTMSIKQYKLNVSNQFVEPSYWSDVSGAFGLFSVAKLKFMMQVTGLTDFSYEALGVDGYYNLPVTLATALAEYEAANGPLIDENGNRVTF
ncbi:DUF4843 domain-containing protein [uncultured Chitinophaga sp.]|uniref:DUF4843 domain-containing protein n=1 Tax=uncultured Chitinophaga sp. TaxID=339340 RepID=UPI0025F69EF1|nr:DUF4843 domain-containing protein [uncultured Chitinophaga sp.]